MQSTLTRHTERARTDRALLHQLLTQVTTGTLATVDADGDPWAVPMLHALDGDRLLVHGSTGAGLLRHIAAGAPVVYTVFTLDAWVVGHTTFNSSADYRSATVRGVLHTLEGDEKARALDVFSDSLFPGRVAEVRPMSARELAATRVSELRLVDGSWLYKERTHGADEPDEQTTAWGGRIPVEHRLGAPVPAPWCTAPLPDSVRAMTGGAGSV